MVKLDETKKYDAMLLAVATTNSIGFDFEGHNNAESLIYDAKTVVDRQWVDGRL